MAAEPLRQSAGVASASVCVPAVGTRDDMAARMTPATMIAGPTDEAVSFPARAGFGACASVAMSLPHSHPAANVTESATTASMTRRGTSGNGSASAREPSATAITIPPSRSRAVIAAARMMASRCACMVPSCWEVEPAGRRRASRAVVPLFQFGSWGEECSVRAGIQACLSCRSCKMTPPFWMAALLKRPDRGPSPGMLRILRFAQDDNSLYRDDRDSSLRR